MRPRKYLCFESLEIFRLGTSLTASFFILGMALATIDCRAQKATDVPKWSMHEISLEASGTYDNPYTQVNVSATFNGPENVSQTVKGFWNGKKLFIIRFTPTAEGIWRYTTKSEDGGMNEKHGTINCTAPEKGNHGFLRRDASHPYHFVYDDSTRYFMFGTTYYEILANAADSDRWKQSIDGITRYGINKVRMNAGGGSPNTKGSGYTNSDPFDGAHDKLNIVHLQNLDDVVEYMLERNVVAELLYFFNNESSFGTQEQDERYLRYIIARYAAYPNVIWCLTNEWEYTDKTKSYWNNLGPIIYDEDPWTIGGNYPRLLSIHQRTRVDWQFEDAEWPSHIIIQYGVRNPMASPKGTPPLSHGDAWGNLSISYNRGHNMPVVNDEYGYAGEPKDDSEKKQKQDTSKVEDASTVNSDEFQVFTRKKHRQVMWGIYTAGGYGSTGDKYQYEDLPGRPYFGANWHAIAEYDDVKHLIVFFTTKGIEYWKMSGNNSLVNSGERVYVLAEKGKQYVIYAAAGGTFSVKIPSGKYRVRRYDPRTGEDIEIAEVEGGSLSFDMPDGNDWVIYMTNQNL